MNLIKRLQEKSRGLDHYVRGVQLEEKTKRQEEDNREKQEIFGGLLRRSLENAAKKNNVYNLMQDGTRYEEATIHGFHTGRKIGPVMVDALPSNGRSYSICVGIPNPTINTGFSPRYTGYPICQLDLNLEKLGEELHVHYGAYGKDKTYPLDSLEDVIQMLERHVEEFRLFPTIPQKVNGVE